MVRACGDPGPMSRITTIAFPPVLGGTPWEPAACPTLLRCGQPTVQQPNCKPSQLLVRELSQKFKRAIGPPDVWKVSPGSRYKSNYEPDEIIGLLLYLNFLRA